MAWQRSAGSRFPLLAQQFHRGWDGLQAVPLAAALEAHKVLVAGPSRARLWRGTAPVEGAIFAETIPFSETRDYVKKVMANTVYYAAVLGTEPTPLKTRLGVVPPRRTPEGVAAIRTEPVVQ